MTKLVGVSEEYEYQHNATKNENRIYVTRGNSKFAIIFKQTTYNVLYSLRRDIVPVVAEVDLW